MDNNKENATMETEKVEPDEVKYRGWKVMPLIIGKQFNNTLLCLLMFKK